MTRRPFSLELLVTAWLALGLCGCPGSPLADILAQQRGDGGQTPDDPPPNDLPVPRIYSSSLQDSSAVIEFGLPEGTDESEIFGYSVYRSDERDGGFTRQRAFARFEDLIFVDQVARPGTDYFYRVVSVDRLGNESEPSDVALISVPIAPNQIVVYADRTTGKIDIDRFGVSDLNAGDNGFTDDDLVEAVRAMGIRWWRVGMARWDAGQFLNEAEIIERDYFFGTTMADAANPAFYDFEYMDRVVRHVLATGARPIITIDTMPRTLALTDELLFRAPVMSWSDNVRNSPPSSVRVFAEVVKRVIMHYTQGWADGQVLNLQYWELWHIPDVDERFGGAANITWTGTRDDYYDLYAAVHRAVKSEFGDAIKLGGGAFAMSDTVGPFLDALEEQSITPDFVSVVAVADFPLQITSTVRQVREELADRSMADVELIVSDWNLEIPTPGIDLDAEFFVPNPKFDAVSHAVHYLAVVQGLMDLEVTIATHEALRDRTSGINPGLLTLDNGPKPVSVMVEALQAFVTQENRLDVGSNEAVAIAGMDDEATSVTLMLANPENRELTFNVDVRSLPWSREDPFDWSLRIMSDSTFASDGGFAPALGGMESGRAVNLQPQAPPFSIIVLEIQRRIETGPPEDDDVE